MRFKVGDRIRLTCMFDQVAAGLEGIIICKYPYSAAYHWGVRFDNPNDYFHSLERRVEHNHGYWAPERVLELAVPLSPLEVQIRAYVARELS